MREMTFNDYEYSLRNTIKKILNNLFSIFFGSPCPARTGDNSVNSRVLYQCQDFIPKSVKPSVNSKYSI